MEDDGPPPTAAAAAADQAHPTGGASFSSSLAKRAPDANVDFSEQQPPATRGPPANFHTAPSSKPPRLHRDVLQSIFAFFDRATFALVLRISQEWRSTAVRMPSRQWSIECSTEFQLGRLLASPLRRHVRCLVDSSGEYLSASQLQLIVERLAHLDELECRIALTPGMAPPHWPANLTKLTLRLQLETEVAEEISSLMTLVGESLVRCAPMVDQFAIRSQVNDWRDHPTAADLLTPLLAWPLQRLTINGPVSPEAYPIIRRMAHLTYIRFNHQGQFVHLMSAEGPMPPLEEIQTSSALEMSDNTLPLLVELPPTLRKLELGVHLTDPTPLVPLLRHLHTLRIWRASWCTRDLFVSALSQATQLTDLSLQDGHIQAAHLAAILPPMRRLKRLRLVLTGLRSLDFLSSAAHLAETLTHLDLAKCRLDPAEVRHLRPLHALVEVHLTYCFTSPLDGDTLATPTPGAAGLLKEA